jgi:hypothetical protein
MTTAGWIIMLLSVGSVTILFGWCIWRVLFHHPPADTAHMHGMDITPPDEE